MGKTILLSSLKSEELLLQLHNKIELHFMCGLQLARLLDVRELYRSGQLKDDNFSNIENRICKVADERKALRSDIVTIKNHICERVQNLADMVRDDIGVLEINL